jgi:large subunit ribosomal protein L25
MAEKITFQAKSRTLSGKKVGQLRRMNQIPANVSGNVDKTVPVSVEQLAFERLYDKVGDTGLFYLKVEGEKTDRPVLVGEVQSDPISQKVLHVVFRQVSLSEKVTAEVPVEVVGETEIKNAIVAVVHDAIKVEALPQDLPEKFVIDISTFTEIGQMVTFNELEYDRNLVRLDVEEEQLATPVVMVQEVKEEKEEVVAAAPAEGEAVATEGAEATAAAPAEGAAAAPAEEKR